MKQSAVITELKEMIQSQIERVQAFEEAPKSTLSASPSEDAWNVLQCLEHLNRYAAVYLEQFQGKVGKTGTMLMEEELEFKPGFWGKKFADSMLPNEKGKVKKMKTFKSKDPAKDESRIESLEKFLDYQNQWLKILNEVEKVDLNKNKCKLTIPLIKMNLGSTLRFVTFHQERHIQQAERALDAVAV